MKKIYGKITTIQSDNKVGFWKIECEPHVTMRIKRLFGRVKENSLSYIQIQDTEEVCKDLLWVLDRYPMDISSESLFYMKRKASSYDQRIEDFSNILNGLVSTENFELALPPREYQKIATELWLRSKGLLVADDLGLGKTLIGIAGLTKAELRPSLVVTMTHLTYQWEREVHKFAPGLTTHVVKKGRPYEIKLENGKDIPDILITNYHKLWGWKEALEGKIKSIIFDEAQELRISGSNKYLAADYLGKDVQHKLGLSASPVFNYGGEMYNILNIVRPGVLGSPPEFLREWCGGGVYVNAGKNLAVDKPKVFGAYLRDQGLMIRRTKKDVGMELPPLIKIPHFVESDPKIFDRDKSSVSELAKIILSNSSDVLAKGRASRELDWRLRQATGISKAIYVAEFVKMLLESVDRVVLFGWHRAVYDIWAEKLKKYRPVFYTGTESISQKEKARRSFCTTSVRGNSRILIMSLRSGLGLDGLQDYCCTAVHGELDWSPAVHNQCDGRLDRSGQTQSVSSYYLISDHGSDPIISDLLGIKRKQMNGVTDPKAPVITELNIDPDRIKRLAEDYLNKYTAKK